MADTATTGVAAAAQTNEPLIRVEGLRKSFGSLEVLKGIDLAVSPGEVVTIIGASGSGKSTLLRCLNLLETPDTGHIWFHGQDLTAERCNINKLREDIGMVFQGFNLFNNMDVLDNCTLAPVTLKRWAKIRPNRSRWSIWRAWDSKNSPMPRLVACPVAKSSALPSPAPCA